MPPRDAPVLPDCRQSACVLVWVIAPSCLPQVGLVLKHANVVAKGMAVTVGTPSLPPPLHCTAHPSSCHQLHPHCCLHVTFPGLCLSAILQPFLGSEAVSTKVRLSYFYSANHCCDPNRACSDTQRLTAPISLSGVLRVSFRGVSDHAVQTLSAPAERGGIGQEKAVVYNAYCLHICTLSSTRSLQTM